MILNRKDIKLFLNDRSIIKKYDISRNTLKKYTEIIKVKI